MRRRDFLRGAGAGAVAVTTAAGRPPDGVFRHGVASGDPLSDRVLLWTRVSGAEADVEVTWLVGRDHELADVVGRGTATAAAARDHTVQVDATGLAPDTTWYYAFEAGGERSPVGRTRTAPAPGALPAAGRLRIGVVSCAAYAEGWFTAYGLLAERDLDLVVHLGDYIYEHDEAPVAPERRHDPPDVARTLEDYRRRHAQHRTDTDLQRLHQLHPLAAVWDDHDVADNAWSDGAGAHDPEVDGPWGERRAAAVQAWLEWLPVRRPAGAESVHRTLALGALADLVLIDTRLEGRDRQVDGDAPDVAAAVADPDRHLVSPAQMDWLTGQLTGSSARWRLLANQVMLAPARLEVPDLMAPVAGRIALVADGEVLNPDQWDGYAADRDRLLAVLAGEGVGNVVVLTGDLHSSWAAEVPDPAGGDRPLAAEFVVPSVSSTSFADVVGTTGPLAELTRQAVALPNPHLRWVDLERHGYVVLDVAPDAVQADWWHLDTVMTPGSPERLAASWRVADGRADLTPAQEAMAGRGTVAAAPAGAPPPGRADPDRAWSWGLLGTAVAAAAGTLVWLRRRATTPVRG